MRIMIDTSAPMSPTDVKILQVLLDSRQALVDAPVEKKEAPVEEAPVEEGEFTLEQVVSMATDLVQQGHRDKVRLALDSVGAKRVSSLKTPEQIEQFGRALQ